MNPELREKDYKKIANFTGLCLILFVVMFNVTGVASVLISELIAPFISYDAYYTISSVLSIISYLSSFIVPALILRAILKRFNVLQPMNLEFRLPTSSLLLIPAGIGVTMTLAYVNSLLLSFLDISDAYAELVGGTNTVYTAYQILLLYVSTALVPAVCEEFLFRGTILANLRPFGQGVAIVVSSVLFGLMHQNPYQLLYTTAAGFVLGYAYVKTRSIWCPTLIHFFNNAFSVTEQVILSNAKAEVANIVIPIMDVGIIVVGFICFAVFLAIDAKKQRGKYRDGSFGVLLEESESYTQRRISSRSKLRFFTAPGMIIFVIVALSSVVMTLAMLMLLSGVSVLS